MTKLLILLAGLTTALLLSGCDQRSSVVAASAVYYVAPNGNDANPGTEAQPWQTIQKAADTLVAGDTVYIRAGTYHERVAPQNSGSAGQFITYAAYPSEAATIDGTGVDVPEYGGLFDLAGRDYLRVSGLRVIHSSYYGIVADTSSHVAIEHNYTYDTFSSGISAWNSDNIIVDGNEVVGACTGPWQEHLSISNTDAFEVRYNHIHDVMPGTAGKEGLSVKDASSHGKVYGNHVHDLNRVGIYVDAEAEHLFDIEVHQNLVHDIEAMGFALASEQGGLLENVRLYNNIAYNNLVGLWLSACCIATHPFQDITIINNTFAYNGRDGWGGGIGIENTQVQNVVIRNNICSQNTYSQMAADPSILPALTIDHNLTDGDRDPEFEFYGVGDLVDVSPSFVNPLTRDYHLLAGSPAIDQGSSNGAPLDDFDGLARDAQPDIGACEWRRLEPTSTATMTSTPAPTPTRTPTVTATPTGTSPGPTDSTAYLRLNQVGYLPGETKIALALTAENLSSQTFSAVADPGGSIVFTGHVGADRRAYGDFAHVYELNFTGLTAPGTYRLRLGNNTSPVFNIGANAYADLISPTLRFFRVQRCGNTAPVLHGVCHLKDGIVQGGRFNGAQMDATGGWHDAGDYLKFLITTGAAANLMLTAYQRRPEVFADSDSNGVPDVLDEVRVGLDWMLKMWDPTPTGGVLYYQVGDASDHDTWRMPEGDDANRPPRPVWPCEPGQGANVAGKAAAALALASALWNDPTRSFYNPTLASIYRTAAEQIYAYGTARPAAQSSTSGFYAETSWQDDLALAAAELYRATGNATYLSEARTYAAAAGNAWTFDYADMHGLAHYEIARLDATYLPTATAFLAADLHAMQTNANTNPFRATVDYFYWGSAAAMIGAALEALWYEDLSGDITHHTLAQSQRDYVLGNNPWGVSFVNSIGSTWPHHPHHQVADLTHSELVGFWDEGPMARADWQALGITLKNPDLYAAFQSDAAVYHDDVEDYATNEPTIDANALGLALTAWYAVPASGNPTATPSATLTPRLTPSPTSTPTPTPTAAPSLSLCLPLVLKGYVPLIGPTRTATVVATPTHTPTPTPTATPHGIWKPAPNTSWQWQLTDAVNQSFDAVMYDIEMFDNSAAVVAALHAQGRKVVCYISVGSWENWRPDASRFPAEVIGNDYAGWPGEKWLDIRRPDLLGPIMRNRMDQCQAKGFDALEPDNIDGYANDTGFPLTYEDQIDYNLWLAEEAHARGLSIALKNDLDQVHDLLPYFDWALSEDCFYYQECSLLTPFYQRGQSRFRRRIHRHRHHPRSVLPDGECDEHQCAPQTSRPRCMATSVPLN